MTIDPKADARDARFMREVIDPMTSIPSTEKFREMKVVWDACWEACTKWISEESGRG